MVGAEVRFSELDGLFGVDAAKQRIRNIKKINLDSMINIEKNQCLRMTIKTYERLNQQHTEVSKQVDKMMAKTKKKRN